MAENDRLYAAWRRWIHVIGADVRGALLTRHVYAEVRAIVAANPRIQEPAFFHGWLADLYAANAVVAVRRQVDQDRRCFSLARLLGNIAEHPGALTRERTVRARVREGGRAWDAAADFDELVGAGRDTVDPAAVSAHLSELQERAAPVKAYTDRRIAHQDRRGTYDLPTYDDLDACFACIEKNVALYMRLLCGERLADIPSEIPPDWQNVFRAAWAPDAGV